MMIPIMSKLFRGIDPEDGVKLMHRLGATTRNIPRGAPVLREGQLKRNIGILLSGQLEMYETDAEGHRSMVGFVKPPESFAQVFAFADVVKHPCSVFATEDSKILVIPIDKILPRPGDTIDATYCRFLDNLFHDMGNTAWNLRARAFILSRRSTEEKLMTYLREKSNAVGSKDFKIPFNRQELADFLCVDRSALSALMSRLSKRGLFTYHKNHFVLT